MTVSNWMSNESRLNIDLERSSPFPEKKKKENFSELKSCFQKKKNIWNFKMKNVKPKTKSKN